MVRESLMKMAEMSKAVCEWSKKNFGEQRAKHGFMTAIEMGPIAPLLGIGEEIGELYNAENPEDEIDAKGDIGVYLMDYCGRYKIDLVSLAGLFETLEGQSLPVAYGRLLHCQLKQMQGIRGFDDHRKFDAARDRAVAEIICNLLNTENYVDDVLAKVVGKVLKRDWVANVMNADKVAEALPVA